MLRAYRAALIPLGLGAMYVVWCLWQVRGGDPLLDHRINSVILASLATGVIVLWPRNHEKLARLAGEVRALRWQVEELMKPLVAQSEQHAFTVGIVHGQLTTVNAKLDAVTARLDELVSDAYVDGLAARQMRDWDEPPTRPISPQVNGLRINGRN